jgi:hypothetical protein
MKNKETVLVTRKAPITLHTHNRMFHTHSLCFSDKQKNNPQTNEETPNLDLNQSNHSISQLNFKHWFKIVFVKRNFSLLKVGGRV